MDQLDWTQCQQCLAGDADACAALLKRHEPRIARHMWRFARDRGTQAELVQEVMVEAYLSLKRYRPATMPMAHWLARIATRVGYRHWKRQARARRHQPLEAARHAPAPTPPENDAAAAQLLHELLGRLGTADRLVLTLMYFEECSVKQIAHQTGWNSAMVKMRLYRARNRLAAIIRRENLTQELMDYAR